jgi:hypothetical protein
MKIKLIFLFSLFSISFGFSQEHIVRGYLFDDDNGEAVPFEQVILIPTNKSQAILGASAAVDGLFSIAKVPMGTYLLRVASSEYQVYEKEVVVSQPKGITEITINLVVPDKNKLGEVVISGELHTKATEVLMSQIKLDKRGVERIPSVGGENDVVAAFSVTPGVVTTGDQGGQLYVRGGTPIQNKVLLDGMTIYNPFHTIGFFSIFETELIQNVDIYTGGFDAKYGGRISSVMDITYRDGNKKQLGGKVSLSPFLGKLVLEGPVYKSKSGKGGGSFIFSGKHSLLDYTSKSLYRGVNNGNGLPYNFTDLYGKVTLSSGQGSKFSFFGFHNNDNTEYYGVANLGFTQGGGGMNFTLVPSGSPTIIRGHMNVSNYKTTFQETANYERFSSIQGADLGFDFTYFLKGDGRIDYGLNMNVFATNFVTYNEAASKIEARNNSTEIGAYINYKYVNPRFVIQPGLRVQAYASLGTISVEPRIGIKYNATDRLRLKLSGGRYTQNFTSASSDRDVVNLFNGLLSAPTNVQEEFITEFGKVKNPKNGLQISYHAIVGTEYDLTSNLSLNVEVYYKYFPQLSNINTFKLYDDISDFADKDDIEKKDFLIESGQTYGADLLLKYNKGRLFLWGVYSYGHSTRWNGFETYYPVFDRRHNVNLVGSYLFGAKKTLELNMRWNIGSGLPYTPTSGFYQSENFNDGATTDITQTNSTGYGLIFGDFNSQRLPYYHRLDITVKKRFVFGNKTEMELVGSVTNAYNRKNIFYVNRVTNEIVYQFPIMPSFGLSYKF